MSILNHSNFEWKKDLPSLTNGKCRGCSVCNGIACKGEVPGLGGVEEGKTFFENVKSLDELALKYKNEIEPLSSILDKNFIATAPMTGVEENMGSPCNLSEAEFHYLHVKSAKAANIECSIGDGFPEFKFEAGVKALEENNYIANIFIKPYPNKIIFEKIERSEKVAKTIGIDIDSVSIATMAGKTKLEGKDLRGLREIKKRVNAAALPFVLKGICDKKYNEIVEEVKPDIIVASNHGGRIAESTNPIGFFLESSASYLKNYCDTLWADSGFRKKDHLQFAKYFGVDKVLIGRPVISFLTFFKVDGIAQMLKRQFEL